MNKKKMLKLFVDLAPQISEEEDSFSSQVTTAAEVDLLYSVRKPKMDKKLEVIIEKEPHNPPLEDAKKDQKMEPFVERNDFQIFYELIQWLTPLYLDDT